MLGRDVYFCRKCKTKLESTKQLTIKKLPFVLCFHLKRFEHGLGVGKKKSVKIDDFIEFPTEIDMYPYTSVHRSEQGEKKKKRKRTLRYSLFAVVQHKGSMESGHYTCYVKHNQQWYLCDDAMIYLAQEAEVLSCKG